MFLLNTFPYRPIQRPAR